MILPIVAYGDPVLKKKASPIEKAHPNLKKLIDDMWETMYAAQGVGLAAPQIGESIRLFIVDGSPFANDKSIDNIEQRELKNFKKVFINPEITAYSGLQEAFNEGCLSIPDVREDVTRLTTIEIEYYNEKFEQVREEYSGISSRIIQHEYDHIEGVLFTDKLGPLKKKLLKTKLAQISKGKINPDYPMRFPSKNSVR
ncbi:MAG: peptide deformylase [Bacteroidetes bacterium]|nr:peptide deformylase [Bacteroidota bacterium]MDA0888614.1 peptide deformylase [Bacteroidota bacterium]MDA1085016.1 peptide deformylase [Bacteroidota bacterium]